MTSQQAFGRWIMNLGRLLLVVVAIVCLVDVAGLSGRGGLAIELSGYLTAIVTGVGMQFLGAAIPNMQFAGTQK